MKDPQIIETIAAGATYELPTYFIDKDGSQDGEPFILKFCKGNKEGDAPIQQEGLFTETIIKAAKQYLEDVNVGEMASRETSMAITKLDEALMWIEKRSNDRKRRGVQNTYKK